MKFFATVFLILAVVSIGYAEGGGFYYTMTHLDTAAATINFGCNMSVQMKRGAFDPAVDTLWLSGSFNNFDKSIVMTDLNNDSLYTYSLHQDSSGNTLQFKFRYVHGGTMNWENDPNRTYLVPSGSSDYTAWFNNDSVYNPPVDIAMTFSVNMELERLSGRFNPNTDTVSVNGDFQGWSPKKNILTSNPLNPDLYEGTFTLHRAKDQTITFKFWYQPNNWESVSNRTYTFTAADVANGFASYSGSFNNGTLATVINQPCAITFTVNTNGAVSSVSGLPFPAVNTVSIAGSALPLQWPGGGWPNGDSGRVIRLYDDGTHSDVTAGDHIFTNVLTIPSYTVLQVQYKYGINFGDGANNGGGNDNESAFATNHVLNMTRYMSSATVIDTFGRMHDAVLANITGVKEQPKIPTSFGLAQNYPNPFNPTTSIKYMVPHTSNVVLKVYDTFGREVATLVNGQVQAGEYTVRFGTNNLASGVYFYRIIAGSFVETKKMLLVK
jgi:hypothetical protein